MAPLRPYLDDESLTELCINRPYECFIERAPDSAGQSWQRIALPFADFPWCLRLAKLIANHSHQRLDTESPLLSATLPTGERAQIVMPPATTDSTVSITLRKPSTRLFTLDELAEQGTLAHTRSTGQAGSHADQRLQDLLSTQNHLEFLKLAVRSRKNILLSGATGSGKTTWTKALMQEIPADERLIAIEDARELVLDKHPNHVRLYYSKDGQGQARVTPKQLLEATLRMKPDRILLAELRGDEAFHYLRNINSGHPGSITSIHAASPTLALEQLVLLVKESAAGRELARADILELLHHSIDVVLQVSHHSGIRAISEVVQLRTAAASPA